MSSSAGAQDLSRCWTFSAERGFLLAEDPVTDLRAAATGLDPDVAAQVQELGESLPDLLHDGSIRNRLDSLQVMTMSGALVRGDGPVVERLLQVFVHLANAYLWADPAAPATRLPAGVAVPLVELSEAVGRPPILSYASSALANHRLVDPTGQVELDNLRCIQALVGGEDEDWFHLIHIVIERHAGAAVAGCLDASAAAAAGDLDGVAAGLSGVPAAIDRMISTFQRMPERCSPDVFYRTLRPFLFGMDGVTFEGVESMAGRPQHFGGQTAAQSSVIPALQRLLGLRHRPGGLTSHLDAMLAHMPLPHRHLLDRIDVDVLRSAVVASADAEMRAAYNTCVEGVLDFRSLHLRMARGYVASKVDDPTGTGGTEFMVWLTQLRDETAAQLL